MEVTIRCDDHVVEFLTSYVFDPYEELRAWLERIAAGEAGALEIDPEGGLVILQVEPAEAEGHVRFTVTMEHSGRGEPSNWKSYKTDEDGRTVTVERACDVTMPRTLLVAGVYAGLMARWEQPTPDQFWDAWLNTSPEIWAENYDEPYGSWRYQMRSERVEAYLAEASGVTGASG